jgi:hypothetical protein
MVGVERDREADRLDRSVEDDLNLARDNRE